MESTTTTTSVAAGLELLERSPPLWSVPDFQWREMIAIVKRIELAWGDPVRALGSSDLSIDGPAPMRARRQPGGHERGLGSQPGSATASLRLARRRS